MIFHGGGKPNDTEQTKHMKIKHLIMFNSIRPMKSISITNMCICICVYARIQELNTHVSAYKHVKGIHFPHAALDCVHYVHCVL